MKEWDYGTRQLRPYRVPEDWKCPLFAADMEEHINCARCGKEVTFGEAYTSTEIFEDTGTFGHCVCNECIENEYYRAREDNT